MAKIIYIIFSSVIIISLAIVLFRVSGNNQPKENNVPPKQKFEDEFSKFTFDYPANITINKREISKDASAYHATSMSFFDEENGKAILPIQLTIFSKAADDNLYSKYTGEVFSYYKDNGKAAAEIEVAGKPVTIYEAEKQSDDVFIQGFYINEADALFLLEYFHQGKPDAKADELYSDIVSSLEY